jgi:FkbM family methyltransferase
MIKSRARSVAKSLYHVILRTRPPLPEPVRAAIRNATRSVYHRRRLFQHDSRHRLETLALRTIHECLIRTHPADFDIYGGRLRFRSSGSAMSTHGYYVGEFEFHLLQFIVANLRDNAVILDIGAHHGEFAVPLAYEFKQRGWRSLVWSFEPDPENVVCITYNLAQNGLSEYVRLHSVAVSDTASDHAELLRPADNSSNTLSYNAEYAIGDELTTATRTTVRTVRVDDLDLGAPVALVKLDVQGSEPEVLKGAMNTIRRDQPILVLEVVESWPRAPELKEILASLGYKAYGLTSGGKLVPVGDPQAFVSWDWIAMPAAGLAAAPTT